jgi:hypothetical protein
MLEDDQAVIGAPLGATIRDADEVIPAWARIGVSRSRQVKIARTADMSLTTIVDAALERHELTADHPAGELARNEVPLDDVLPPGGKIPFLAPRATWGTEFRFLPDSRWSGLHGLKPLQYDHSPLAALGSFDELDHAFIPIAGDAQNAS